MKRIIFLAPLSLFLLVGLYFAVGLTRDPSRIPSTLIDRPVPVFDLAAPDGGRAGLSSRDLVGEVSIVNVFGSWCIGCTVEHPLLLEIADEGVAPIHGVNWKDKPEALADWLARRGDPYARIGVDADGRTAIDFGVTGAPETFIVDRQGRIRHKHVGPISRDDWETVLRPLIEELKNAPSSSSS